MREELDKSFVYYSITQNKGDDFRLAIEVDGVSSTKFDPTLIPGKIFAYRDLKLESKPTLIKTPELLHPGLTETKGNKCEENRKEFLARRWATFCLTPAPQFYLFKVQTSNKKQFEERLLNSFLNASSPIGS